MIVSLLHVVVSSKVVVCLLLGPVTHLTSWGGGIGSHTDDLRSTLESRAMLAKVEVLLSKVVNHAADCCIVFLALAWDGTVINFGWGTLKAILGSEVGASVRLSGMTTLLLAHDLGRHGEVVRLVCGAIHDW